MPLSSLDQSQQKNIGNFGKSAIVAIAGCYAAYNRLQGAIPRLTDRGDRWAAGLRQRAIKP